MAVRLLYVAGYGRSGSTLLDVALASHPRAAGFGELRQVPARAWRGEERCACGTPGSDCPFWSRVRERWEGALARDGGGDGPRKDRVQELAGLQRRFEGRRAWPALALAARGLFPAFRSYARSWKALLEALAEESGAEVLIDSSKCPARAFALSLVEGIDLRLVHLVRDARGVAHSLARPFAEDPQGGVQRAIPPRPAGRSALAWTARNLEAGWVRRRLPAERSLRLRYEDLVADPRAALAPAGALAGLDLSSVGRALAAGEALPVGHAIAGNRLRMAGSVRLAPDHAWHEGLAAKDERAVWRRAGWLLRRYGYRRERSASGGVGDGR